MGSHVLNRLKCSLAQLPWIILLNLHCTLLCHSLLYTANPAMMQSRTIVVLGDEKVGKTALVLQVRDRRHLMGHAKC